MISSFLFLLFQFNYEIFNSSELANRDSFRKNQPGIEFADTLIYTPFGSALKSNIHYIDNKHHLVFKNENIQVTNSQTGLITEIISLKSSLKNLKGPIDFKDGWGTYAYCQAMEYNPEQIEFFSTDWIVPQPPINQTNQLIYLFNGLGTIEDMAYILQPVLQWGKSPAGGGNYWSVCNWFVTSNQFFYDSLIKVKPGTKLEGLIKLISSTDSLFNYTSSFNGLTSEFQVLNSPRLYDPYVVLETYNLVNCNQYPSQEKVTMSNITIKAGDIDPPVLWTPSNNVVGCGQLTKIIKNDSNSGMVDIYFRTPSSDNYFDVIQIYPNPVGDILRINSLKEISNCMIQIYNIEGKTIEKFLNVNIKYIYGNDYGIYYELNLQNYKPGLYLLNVVYENKSHTFKIIKK